jgi:hypothetical protein
VRVIPALAPTVRDPARYAPVFVLASARSYSSIVSMMIGQHPALFGTPELKLFAYPTLADLDASLPTEARRRGFTHRSPGLVRAVAELEFGAQTRQALTAAGRWLAERGDWTGADVLDLLMARISPRAVVEKSPEHVSEPGALARLAAAYPRAWYIHLIRHPVGTIRSMHEHLLRNLPGYPAGDFMRDCIAAWLDAHHRIVAFASRVPAERWLRLRAEDVLNDPTPHLVAVANWLEIASEAGAIDAMRHPERSPFACFAPAASGVSGGSDPAFLRDPRPHRVVEERNVDPRQLRSADPALWAKVQRATHELGY